MNDLEIKELESLVRIAIQNCFDMMTDEQVFIAVFDYSRFDDQKLVA